jgi:crossover junction endodeoxyribonuclease RusA
MATRTYRLPWPPSVNNYIKRGNNRTYMTKQGKKFRGEVCDQILGEETWGTLRGRLSVHIELTMPSKAKRDIDNHIKAVLDSLQAAGVFENDEQVDHIRVTRLHVEPPGACDVTITELSAPPTRPAT